MVTISIPQIKKGDFLLISRKKYEKLIKRAPKTNKKSKITKGHFLYEALQEVKQGKTRGPFNTAEELWNDLNRGYTPKRKIQKKSK